METRSKTKQGTNQHVDSVVNDLPLSSVGQHSANGNLQSQHLDAHRSPALGDELLTTSNADVSQRPFSSRSCHSSATVRAMRLEAEAELVRRRAQRARQLADNERQREAESQQREAERQRELARLEDEADELAMRAKFAACDSSVKSFQSSHRSHCVRSDHRTSSWVLDQNENRVQFQRDLSNSVRPITSEPPLPRPTANSEPHRDTPLRLVGQSSPLAGTNVNPQIGAPPQQDPICQLTQAISALNDRPKRPDLSPFSGDISNWMAFKSSYDRTNHLYSPAENMSRLSQALRGAAYQAIASLLWASSDPNEVMRALEQSFARPEILVAHEVATLRNIPKISNPEQINSLANKIRNCVSTIKILGQYEFLYSQELFRAVLSKLSEHIRSRFTDYAATNMPITNNISKIEMLSSFLLLEADRQLKYNFTLDIAATSSFHPKVINSRPGRETVHATSATASTPQPPCQYCKQGPHTVKTCKAFQLLSVDDRWQWIRSAKVCYRCMKNNPHKWNECRAKRCGTNGCTRRHHALLHGTNTSRETSHLTTDQINTATTPEERKTCTSAATADSKYLPSDVVLDHSSTLVNLTGMNQSMSRPRGLLKVLPVVVEGPDGSFNTAALLDEGSTTTLIDSDVAARIGAKPSPKETLQIIGVGGMTTTVEASFVSFYIRGRNLPNRHLVEHARAITRLSLNSQNTRDIICLSDFPHLADLEPELTHEQTSPMVLIGAADWHLTVSREIRVGRKNEIVASRTLLGWCLHGAVSTTSKPIALVNNISFESKPDELEILLKHQYEVDSIGITKIPLRRNKEDQRAIDIIEATAHRLADGRFEVGLPWKENLPGTIPDSYPQALSRFKTLERQMLKDENFANAYRTFMYDIINKGYAEECDLESYHGTSRTDSSENFRWYVPTFGVFHPQKKKIRIVHDAAAVTRGVSLNSLLLQGPDLLQSLLNILFRFREGPIAFNADIREMFPQIKILPKDRDAQRFLWRTHDGSLREFRMASMIFGAVSSPFIALHIKDKNAKDHEGQYPEAYKAILKDHYMDDYLGSHFDLFSAQKLAADIVTVHGACGYEMRAWVSNKPEALALVPKNLRDASSSEVDLVQNKEIGVLGVKWNSSLDSFSFRHIPHFTSDKLTKRLVLSHVMKIYDPLGLLIPIIIHGRILLQKLWREGTDWDTPIPPKYISDFDSWLRELDTIIDLKVPRWYFGRLELQDIQLHIFADAGEQAYACVAYWRTTFANGSIAVTLIGSKARVAPLKPISIPRLELQAALIANRFCQCILNAHRVKPSSVVYWIDSTTVLKWIRSDARKFSAFEAHRLGEIWEYSKISQWRWVPTSLNVADDATKIKSLGLTVSHRWFTGPPFLLESSDKWPTEPDALEASLDVHNVELVALQVDAVLSTNMIDVPKAARFSIWMRLVRSTARSPNSKLYRFDTTSPSTLLAAHVLLVEKILFLQAQQDSFPEEQRQLRASQPVSKKSRIAALAPFLDKEGIIRMGSRIRSAPGVSDNTISPIILDGRHHVSRLLIYHYHVNAAHGFHEMVLNELQQDYMILRARNTIKKVSRDCYTCKRKRTPQIPPLGELPPERLAHHQRVFSYVGVDYFGPLFVTVHRRREKRWVALYTCLVTRAVHLELVHSLTADSALLSLRRFIARRGSPTTIMSDNGTNFVGARRELQLLYGEPINDFCAGHKIQWRFIPPASPFMGGAWERMVRSVKTALNACLKDQSPREEILTTLLHEAEAIVNSRPLTYVAQSSDHYQSITPFHFIMGSSSVAPWTHSLSDADLSRRCDWRRTLRLADLFWERWLREYLPTLRSRGKSKKYKQFNEGDVVVIVDPSLPRGVWPLGRIIKTFPGADGVVRVVDVLTKAGTLRRPVRKLLHIVEDCQPVAARS